MRITVEFFGIPRQRAGQALMDVSLPQSADFARLADVLESLAKELPDFARDCLAENRLKPGYIANINGERFITDPATPIADGDALLILSADVGG
jgi:molybdopterin converting factor small subunit